MSQLANRTSGPCTLDLVQVGFRGRICALDDNLRRTASLRRLGFHEGSTVEILSGSDPVLVRCGSTSVAVGREVLLAVTVVAI